MKDDVIASFQIDLLPAATRDSCFSVASSVINTRKFLWRFVLYKDADKQRVSVEHVLQVSNFNGKKKGMTLKCMQNDVQNCGFKIYLLPVETRQAPSVIVFFRQEDARVDQIYDVITS